MQQLKVNNCKQAAMVLKRFSVSIKNEKLFLVFSRNMLLVNLLQGVDHFNPIKQQLNVSFNFSMLY